MVLLKTLSCWPVCIYFHPIGTASWSCTTDEARPVTRARRYRLALKRWWSFCQMFGVVSPRDSSGTACSLTIASSWSGGWKRQRQLTRTRMRRRQQMKRHLINTQNKTKKKKKWYTVSRIFFFTDCIGISIIVTVEFRLNWTPFLLWDEDAMIEIPIVYLHGGLRDTVSFFFSLSYHTTTKKRNTI